MKIIKFFVVGGLLDFQQEQAAKKFLQAGYRVDVCVAGSAGEVRIEAESSDAPDVLKRDIDDAIAAQGVKL